MRIITPEELARLRNQSLYLSNPSIGSAITNHLDENPTQIGVNNNGMAELYMPAANGGFKSMNVTQLGDGTFGIDNEQDGANWKDFYNQHFKESAFDRLHEMVVKAGLSYMTGQVAGGFLGAGGIDPTGLDAVNSYDVGTQSVYDAMANSQNLANATSGAGLLDAAEYISPRELASQEALSDPVWKEMADSGYKWTAPPEFAGPTAESLLGNVKPAIDAATAGAGATSWLDKAGRFVVDNPLKAMQIANGAVSIVGALDQQLSKPDTGGTRTVTIPALTTGTNGQGTQSSGLLGYAPFVEQSNVANPLYEERMKKIKGLLGG